MSRRSARAAAFERVFAYMVNRESETVPEIEELNAADVAYADAVATGVIAHFDELTALIAEKAVKYDMSRIYKVDFAILLVAAYEIRYSAEIMESVKDCGEINKAISCNEAVDLAKRFSTIKSPSFINGILSKIE